MVGKYTNYSMFVSELNTIKKAKKTLQPSQESVERLANLESDRFALVPSALKLPEETKKM